MGATALGPPPPVHGQSASVVRLRRAHGFRSGFARFARNRTALVGLVLLTLVVFMALAAPLLQTADPIATNLRARQVPPSLEHPMGTDALGRDVWSRVLWGARISLPVGIAVVAVSLAIGGVLGMLAGYFGRLADALVSPIVNLLLALPGLLLAIAMVAALGSGIWQVMLAVGIGQAPRFARLQRSVVLSIRERDYVLAARGLGAGHARVILQHVLPNTIAPMIVLASLTSAHAIVVEASLSFLGLGIPPPAPSWGSILNEGRTILRTSPWVAVYPGLMIMITTLALNVIGDALRDVTDPRLRGQAADRGR